MKLPSEILECETIHYSRHNFPLHLHPDHYTLSLILDGKVTLTLPDNSYHLSPGELIIIPPNMPHKSIVSSYFSYRVIRTSVLLSGLNDYFSNRLVFSKDEQTIQMFNWWYENLKAANQYTLINAETVSFASGVSDNLQLALSYMHNQYDSPIQLSDLSRAAMLSNSHFQRLFKKQLAISPMRYLQSLRIDKAKTLIQADKSMVEVALSTGFYDQSHFHKYFKQLVGMTPGAYHSIVRND
jgi:AraC-like DNA-binding protein